MVQTQLNGAFDDKIKRLSRDYEGRLEALGASFYSSPHNIEIKHNSGLLHEKSVNKLHNGTEIPNYTQNSLLKSKTLVRSLRKDLEEEKLKNVRNIFTIIMLEYHR